MKETIYTDRAPKPLGVYSQGIKSGGFIFTAGQIAINPETQDMIESDIKGQTRQVLKNIDEILKKGSSSINNAVKLTVYMADLGEFGQVNEVFSEFFDKDAPARVVLEASKLPKNAKIEIDCIAVI